MQLQISDSLNEQNTEAQKKYVYIFVRQDMSIQQQFVQGSHAAHECGLFHSSSGTTSSVIIFGIESKQELEALLEKYSQNLDCYPFYEPYKNTGLTAFATKPIPEADRHLFKSFKLWKPKFVQEIAEEAL